MRHSQARTLEFGARLNDLLAQCGPIIRKLASHPIDEVCTEMAELADEKGRLICQKQWQLFQSLQGLTESEGLPELVPPTTQSYPTADTVSLSDEIEHTEKEGEMAERWKYKRAGRTGSCVEVKLNWAIPCSLPSVTLEKEGEHVRFSYGNLCHRINKTYFDKLVG